jgi:hypothetical protein
VHKPSESNRAKVIALVTNGTRQDRVAEHLGIDAKTLRKHYGRELEFGTENLLSRVLNNMASIACKGAGMAAVSAGKYLLSCRGGYREHSMLGVEPTDQFRLACGADNAREIIAAKLAALAARNAEIDADCSEADRAPPEGE